MKLFSSVSVLCSAPSKTAALSPSQLCLLAKGIILGSLGMDIPIEKEGLGGEGQ